jgi:hypothetical protein
MLLETQASDKSGYQDLQKILRQHLTSKEDHVDPSRFVRNWRGWNVDAAIEPGQQHDATDFVRYLLEWLPTKISKAFRIVLIALTKGVSGPYRNRQEEVNWMMPCAILNMPSLKASRDDFFHVVRR